MRSHHQQKRREQITPDRNQISQLSQRENQVRKPPLNPGVKEQEHLLLRRKSSRLGQVNHDPHKHTDKTEAKPQKPDRLLIPLYKEQCHRGYGQKHKHYQKHCRSSLPRLYHIFPGKETRAAYNFRKRFPYHYISPGGVPKGTLWKKDSPDCVCRMFSLGTRGGPQREMVCGC